MSDGSKRSYIRYSPDGRIKSWGTCMETDLVNQSRAGFIVREVPLDSDFQDMYVDVSGGTIPNHVYVDKLVMGLSADKTVIDTDGIDEVTITGLPVGAVVTIAEKDSIVVNDGVLMMTTVVGGVISLSVEVFPYLPEELTVFGAE